MKAIDFELIEEGSSQNENSRFLSGITRSYPTNRVPGVPSTSTQKWYLSSTQVQVLYSSTSTVLEYSITVKVEYFCDNIITTRTRHRYVFFYKYNAQNLVWNWYGSMEDCLPFHSIPFWHLPYRNFRSIPFHTIPCPAYM